MVLPYECDICLNDILSVLDTIEETGYGTLENEMRQRYENPDDIDFDCEWPCTPQGGIPGG